MQKPDNVPPDQEWFWTDEWQAGERAVDEDYAAGRYTTFHSVEEFVAHLGGLSAESAATTKPSEQQYAELAASQDEEDRQFHATVRPRRQDG